MPDLSVSLPPPPSLLRLLGYWLLQHALAFAGLAFLMAALALCFFAMRR